jgi:hypothetical protein
MTMLRLALALAAVLLVASTPASAENARRDFGQVVTPLQPEWVLVRWIGPQRCEVVMARPRFGRWEEVGTYPNKKKAEQALGRLAELRQCHQPPPPPVPDAR